MDKPISVLLVDDENDFIEPIAFWLKSRGYAVATARNGKEAIQKVKDSPPDIMFMDIHMPVMNGLEALKNIRTFNKELPIIMVTAVYGDEGNVTKAGELGVSGFFGKNYTFDQLVSMIHATLRTHKKLQPESREDQSSSHA